MRLVCPYEGCDHELTVKAAFCGRCGRRLPNEATLHAAIGKFRRIGKHERATFLMEWQDTRNRLTGKRA